MLPHWRLLRPAWIGVALASLWLRSGFPASLQAAAVHDDALFVRQARFLATGEWLGPYDNLTLAKGFFFPLFMAAAQVFGVPLLLAEQFVWLAAAALAARLAGRLAGDRRLALLLFAALAFNPVVWDAEMARVVREGLYLSLSLAAVTLLVEVAWPASSTRPMASLRGAGFGLVVAAFWLTREEGAWLLPAFAAVGLLALLDALRQGPPGRLRRLGRLALPLGIATALFAAALGTVAGLNWWHYGVFVTNEFKAVPFLRAYGALARVGQDEWQRYVVFPADARARAYAVSPAARELAGVLDGPASVWWRRFGCGAEPLATCPEIKAGWFMWALRQAAAEAGHAASGAEAMRFYGRIADEIDAACADRRIPCAPPRATLLPIFRWQYLADTARDLPLIARITLRLVSADLGTPPSNGPRRGDADFADLIGAAPSPSVSWFIRGWVAAASAPPALSLRVTAEGETDVLLSTTPAPDLAAALPGWSGRRFDLQASCGDAACALVATAPGAGEVLLPLESAAAGREAASATLRLFIDAADQADMAPLTGRRQRLQQAIARRIARTYAAVTPALTGVAVAGMLLAGLRRHTRRVSTGLLALAIACAVAVLTRIVLLAYLDVTSIPSARVLYTSAATPFVILFAVVGCWCGVRAAWLGPINR